MAMFFVSMVTGHTICLHS